MKKILETIDLMDKTFLFYQEKEDKLLYQYQDSETGELSVLELAINENNQVQKIDIYTSIEGNPYESIHITKDIDGKLTVDYYPQYQEIVSVDKSKKLYNITISQFLDIEDLGKETIQIHLVREGHRKNKLLTKLPSKNNFITKGHKVHKVISKSVKRLEKSTEYLPLELVSIEQKLLSRQKLTTKQTIKEVYQATDNYPKFLYIYDRSYDIVGLKDNILLYRNNEDDTQDLEITFSPDMNEITEVKIIRYKDGVVEGINTNIHEMIITLTKTENNTIKTKLKANKKDYMMLNSERLKDKMQELGSSNTLEISNMSATIEVNDEQEIISGNLNFYAFHFGEFSLKNDERRKYYFLDDEENEYRITQKVYSMYHMISYASPRIIQNLEKKLLNKEVKELVKTAN